MGAQFLSLNRALFPNLGGSQGPSVWHLPSKPAEWPREGKPQGGRHIGMAHLQIRGRTDGWAAPLYPFLCASELPPPGILNSINKFKREIRVLGTCWVWQSEDSPEKLVEALKGLKSMSEESCPVRDHCISSEQTGWRSAIPGMGGPGLKAGVTRQVGSARARSSHPRRLEVLAEMQGREGRCRRTAQG